MLLCSSLIGGWNDNVAQACEALWTPWSFLWCIAHLFFFSFYVVSPLLAYNIFAAFSIDVYTQLRDMLRAEAVKDDIDVKLDEISQTMAADGICLHIIISSELAKAKVMHAMFMDSTASQAMQAKKAAGKIECGSPTPAVLDSSSAGGLARIATGSAVEGVSADGGAIARLHEELGAAHAARRQAEAECKRAMAKLEENMEWMAATLGSIDADLPK